MADTRTVKLIAKLQDNMSGGLRNLTRGAGVLVGAIAAVGAAAFAAAKKISDYGAEIYDLSSATGVAIEDVQALGYVFEQTGGSVSSMSGAIRGLNTFMRTAATGSAEYANVLSQLGIEYNDLRAMTPTDAFLTLTDAIGALDDEMERNIAATTVFGGRYAQQVVGALDQAGGSLRNLTDEFRESGNALSGEQIDALKKYSDAMTDLDYAMKNVVADAIVPMLPQLKAMTDQFTAMAKDILPELVPLVSAAIEVMADNLPMIVDMLVMAAEGWGKINDIVQQNARSTDALGSLQDSLTNAVQTHTMTVEEAMQTWHDQGALIVSVYGMQHREVTRALEDQLNLAAVTEQSQGRITASALGSAGAMMGIAIALQNVAAQQAGAAEDFSIDTAMASAATEATKLNETLKDILNNMKDYVKEAADAKDLIKDKSELEDEYMGKLQAQTEYQNQMDVQRRAAIDSVRAAMAGFATDMSMAAIQGEESWNRFWDNFVSRMVQVTLSNAFQSLFGFATGGIGGLFGGIFGFAGGTPSVPQSGPGPYKAAAGMIVPGSLGSQRDGVPMMAMPGEAVISRQGVEDMRQSGGSVYNVSLSFPSTIGTMSRSQMAQAVPVLKELIQKGGL